MLKSLKKKHIDLSTSIELSTNELTPGILKIFGDHVSRGSNYKAVRVSTISTAQEVVCEALEKYGLEHCNPKDYVLCDVVGQFTYPDNLEADSADKTKKKVKTKKGEKTEKNDTSITEDNKPTWTTEYVRAINEMEKPLVLQSLWKPTNGRSRRFELRKRIELENACFYVNGTATINHFSSDTSTLYDTEKSSDPSTPVQSSARNSISAESKSPTSSELSSPFVSSNEKISRKGEADTNLAPAYDPYLLLLKGYDKRDTLYHKLQDPTIIVGPYVENEKKQCDVSLYSPDIILPHCWIYKKVKVDENESETNFDELQYMVFIEPASGAEIAVNGKTITSTTVLHPGELVMFGNYYLFIFKDPTSVKDADIVLSWLDITRNENHRYLIDNETEKSYSDEHEYATVVKVERGKIKMVDKAIQVELSIDPIISAHNKLVNNKEVSAEAAINLQRILEPKKRVLKSALQLSYDIADEDELLHAIIDICEENGGTFKLTAAYFFIMTIEHSAANFTEIETRKLLLKISSGMQGIAWEKTKEIGKENSARDEDTKTLHHRILPQLKPVLFWLSNALQMLHFLQCNLQRYVLPREDVGSIKDAVLTADEELLSVLEEVIMFTFQQTVYHLTKVLYSALPPILEVNPFVGNENGDNDGEEREAHPSIKQLTEIFSDVLAAAEEHQVHPQIISQIVAYLFFFCNASLFNLLMEKGPITRIFNWTKGVQIRGNLDALEDWAHVNGVNKEYDEYMSKFVSAVGLLSTPKVQLMQYSWDQMRGEYPTLNAAQLQLLLSEYQLGVKQKPNSWYPTSNDVEPALRTNEVLESFATHPPLMLPSTDFIIDLNTPPKCDQFMKHLQLIRHKFSYHPSVQILQEEELTCNEVAELESKTDPLVLESPKEDNEDVDPQSNSEKSLDVNCNSIKLPMGKIDYDTDFDDVSNTKISSNEEVDVKEERVDNDKEKSNLETAIIVKCVATVHAESSSHSDEDDKKRLNGENDNNEECNEMKISNGVEIEFTSEKEEQVSESEVTVLISKAKDLIGENVDDSVQTTTHDVYVQGKNEEDVFVVELTRMNNVLGLGLIDGQHTPLKNSGTFIRSVVPNTPASLEPRLRIGDRILAVNGTDIVNQDYTHAMELIKESKDKVSFLIASSDEDTIDQILNVH